MNAATASAPASAIHLARRRDLFSSDIVLTALKQSFLMLRPDVQWKNPVMFVVEIGAVLTLLYIIQMALGLSTGAASMTYFIALDVWLFLTVLFANFATAIAEERGKAQAETLRKTRVETPAFRLRANGSIETVSSIELRPGDKVVVSASQIIPGDGDVIEGGAVVNEAAITGESAPVIREAGGDRSGNGSARGPRCEGAGRRRRAPQRTRHRYRAAIAGPDEDCAIYRRPCHTIQATLRGALESPRRRGKGGVRSELQPRAIDAASQLNGASLPNRDSSPGPAKALAFFAAGTSDSADGDKRTNGPWAPDPQREPLGGPELKSVHSGRDRPRWGGVLLFEDAAVDGRNALNSGHSPTAWRTG